jgi:methyl-accepting chemotaxis protein
MRSHTDFESKLAANAVAAAGREGMGRGAGLGGPVPGGGGWAWLICLFGKLSYPAKFGLVGATMVVVMGYFTYALFVTNQANVEFSAKERLGVAYIKPLAAVLEHALAARKAAVAASLGQDGDGAAGRSLELAVTAFAPVQARLGGELETGADWRAFQSAWDALRQAPAKDPVGYDLLVGQVLNLIGLACDHSNLTLDPDIDSYYLMDSACVKLPRLLAHGAEIRDLALAARMAHGATPAQQRRLWQLEPLAGLDLQDIATSLAKAGAYNPQLRPALEAPAAQLAVAAGWFGEEGVAQVLGSAPDVSVAQALERLENSLTALAAFEPRALAELDQLLAKRVGSFSAARDRYVGVALAASLLVALLFWGMYRTLTLELGGAPRTVLETVKAIAARRLDTPIQLAPSDTGSLLAAVHDMRNQLREVILELLRTVAELRGAVEELSALSDQITVGSHQQNDASAAIAAAIEQLSTSMRAGSGHAASVRDLACRAGQQSVEGVAIVGRAVGGMHDIASQVRASSEAISELNRRSDQIAKVVHVIRDIADQTNLLALNAAIEAARAGDQGRGFSVVAEEVRTLAERTARSTTEIRDIVARIQSETQGVVSLMETCAGQAEEGAQGSQEVRSTIERIEDSSREVAVIISEIAGAIHEQTQASEAVAQNIERVARMSDENLLAVERAATYARRLNGSAGRLAELAGLFKV